MTSQQIIEMLAQLGERLSVLEGLKVQGVSEVGQVAGGELSGETAVEAGGGRSDGGVSSSDSSGDVVGGAVVVGVGGGVAGSDAASVSTEAEVARRRSAGTGKSWSDEVEEQMAEGVESGGEKVQVVGSGATAGGSLGVEAAVVMPKKSFVSSGVNLTFGQVAAVTGVDGDVGGFKKFVRHERAVGLRDWLLRKAGLRVPSKQMYRLALATYTAGAVPEFFLKGKEELRMLAAIGDAALSLAMTREKYACGDSVERMQNARSSRLSGQHMSERLVASGLSKFVEAPMGVDLAISKAGATALEAMAGVIELVFAEKSAVLHFAKAVALF